MARVDRRGFVATALATGFAASVLPVGAQTITTDAAGLVAGEVKIPVGDGDMPAYRAMPAGGRRLATILVVHEVFGVHEHIKDVCRRFARLGYLAIAPELYARQGNAASFTDIQLLRRELVDKVPDAQVLRDLDATLVWSRVNGGDRRRIAVTGFCWGGRIAWLYAAHASDIKTGIAWYGRLASEATTLQPQRPIDLAGAPEGTGARPLCGARWRHPARLRGGDAPGPAGAGRHARGSRLGDRRVPGGAARLLCRLPRVLPQGRRRRGVPAREVLARPARRGRLVIRVMLIRLDTVSLAFGSRPLLDHVELQVDEGERVCVVGRNGEGKSSLLRLVARTQPPDDGAVWVRPGARVAFLVQDLDAVEDAKVIDIVAGGLAHDAGEHWETSYRVHTVLSRLGLDGEVRFSSLSGGWRRRALLGRALVAEPDVLLLDEPTNHLDIEAIEWLEQMMLEFRGALLFVVARSRVREPARDARGRARSRPAQLLARQLRRVRGQEGAAARERGARRARCSTSASRRKRSGSARASRRGARATRAACARCRRCAASTATVASASARRT